MYYYKEYIHENPMLGVRINLEPLAIILTVCDKPFKNIIRYSKYL